MKNVNLFGDAYQPAQIAQRVQNLGVSKAKADSLTILILAVLAGAFIALGALFYAVVITDSNLGFGITKFIGGLSFCLGLILVVVGGAELFTGNNLMAMAWAGKLISAQDVLRNWGLVYVGNILGSVGTVLLVLWANIAGIGNDAVGDTIMQIAETKAGLSFGEAFARGILCNTLVCLAVWLAMGGHTVTDKILAIIFPITGFVAMGFEHSIANWFYLPLGLALESPGTTLFWGSVKNIIAVTLGNIVGGTLLVAGVYYFAYLRDDEKSD